MSQMKTGCILKSEVATGGWRGREEDAEGETAGMTIKGES